MYIETIQNDHGSVNVFVSFVGKKYYENYKLSIRIDIQFHLTNH